MYIPGFTAETSVYKPRGVYLMPGSTHRADLSANWIYPSLAIYVDGRFVCNGEVTDNGFVTCYPPGGGDGSGRPDRALQACASCYRRCNTKPFAQRAACRADCEDTVC